MIKITINGQERRFQEPVTLVDVLESLGISAAVHIAVAHNNTVLRRDERPGVELSDGDRLEIVRAVGGG